MPSGSSRHHNYRRRPSLFAITDNGSGRVVGEPAVEGVVEPFVGPLALALRQCLFGLQWVVDDDDVGEVLVPRAMVATDLRRFSPGVTRRICALASCPRHQAGKATEAKVRLQPPGPAGAHRRELRADELDVPVHR